MSRRSQWESMRQEARSRVYEVDSSPAVESAPNHDPWFGTPGESAERVCLLSRKPGCLEGKGANHPEEDTTGKGKERGKRAAKAGADAEEEDGDHIDAVRRLHSVEKAEVSLVPVLEPHPSPPLGDIVSAETTYNSYLVLGTPHEERRALAASGSFSAGENIRELSTAGSDNGVMSLQLELAQEKRKNILAEQRLLSLDREIKELRAENMRKVAAAAEDAAAIKVVSAERQLTGAGGGAAAPGARSGGGPAYLEQMVRELQEELDMMKEYTKELEARLAERSSALERRCREVEQKEHRIRQLERTMADELIRRSKEEPAEKSAASVTPTPATAAADDGKHQSRNHKERHHEGAGDAHEEPEKAPREKLIGGVAVPSVVRRAIVLARSRSDQEHPVGAGAHEPATQGSSAPPRARAPSSDPPASHEKPRQRSSSASQQNPQTSGHTTRRAGAAHEPDHSAAARNEGHPQQPRARLASVPTMPRSASLLGRRSMTPVATYSLKTRRRDIAETPAPTPMRPLRAPRKKPVSKLVNPDARSSVKRKSASPTPHVKHAGDSLHAHTALASSTTSRVGVARPPPLESSVLSVSAMSANASTLHHAETRSVVSTGRSRPRISHDDGGNTVIQTSTTTVVTRSVKRHDTPVLVPQPRLDLVEPVRSDQPFISEKFSATTYRPNRLRRYHKEESSDPALSPPLA
ncbi:uncharacterized protein Tco025E_03685 [Trypanosoma conorhini]|uniref:Uncharacterized protein n=1 Tax=Trypanosoma conorhini TaxID=83891 RepID=A0A422PTV3_9TRYP|nr:uncharacterized protein Tco025E_03685 [Trypanosoma conorhini]RNF20927.1 hypothetical protein Tco025E_03685 [Trypanosoma conorhini]